MAPFYRPALIQHRIADPRLNLTMPFDKLERCCLVTVPRRTVGPLARAIVRARNLGFAYAQLASSTARRDLVRLAAERFSPSLTRKSQTLNYLKISETPTWR